MFKNVFVFLGLAVFALSLSGCATGKNQRDLEAQGLRNQVSVLEAQIQSKDQEINDLRNELSRMSEQKSQVSDKDASVDLKRRPSVKQIQMALKNAGYDPGNIDGRMGKQTRDALKAFQRANNLPVNGKANKQTWALLGAYLEKKTK